ncbi:Polynucleotidyl transferase, Ribonuclease H fold [Sesbania bispinosa]|nr:Polynucleotidyl transferase, Ribonuclease H fold [Sesbania bispinosa]
MLSRPWQVQLHHTLREGNAYADFLSKKGARQSCHHVLLEHPLQEMSLMLLGDAYGVNFIRE